MTIQNTERESVLEEQESTAFATSFSFKRLLKFVLPSIIMMVFTSIYGVVDGVFVSKFAGENAFAAVNLIMPVLMVFSSFGFMLGTGGAALVSKLLGEGKKKKANGLFSFVIIATVVLGVIFTAIGEIFMPDFARLLQAENETFDLCVLYGRICAGGITLFMLQNVFLSFFPVAEKSKLGLIFIVSAGLTNAGLDALFMAGFKWGIAGAAIATITGQAVGSIAPLIYFIFNRKCTLCISKPDFDFKALGATCANGSSELMTNVSLSVVNILYNNQLMNLVGQMGVSAYGVLMYVGYIFTSTFIGYSVGVSPIIGYNYGAQNKAELKNVLRKSLIIIAIASVVMCGLSMGLSIPLSQLFVGGNAQTLQLTQRAFLIYSFMFLPLGFNIFSSAFFTALNNGLVSAILSFMRLLVFQVLCIMTLPLLWGTDGVWASNVFAELIAIILTVSFLLGMRKKYGY